jgi:hypothetical protein
MFISLSKNARAVAGGEDFVSVHKLDTPDMEWWRVTAEKTVVCRPEPGENKRSDRHGMWRYLYEGTWVQMTPRQVQERFPEIWQRIVIDIGAVIDDMPSTGQENAW